MASSDFVNVRYILITRHVIDLVLYLVHVLSGPYAGVIIYAVTFSVGFLMAILGYI